MNKLLFLSFLLILPFSCFPGSKLILQTSDGKQIECTQEQKKVLMQSGTIKNMFEDFSDEDESTVPLADISANTFDQIMQCLEPLAEMATLKAELGALEGQDKKDQETKIEGKESKIIKQLNSYSEDDLFNLIQATSFLDIPLLLDYSCLMWSDNYELKRFKNNKPSFNNPEIIEKLKNINISSIKSFLIKKYLENYTPDVKILHYADVVNCVCYSPDGTKIACGLADGTISIRNSNTGKLLKTLKGHNNQALSICYSPDGIQLASASQDNTICIWNAQTYECLHTLKGHAYPALSICYSPDGTELASASMDTTICIWNAQTGEQINSLQGHNESVLSICYNPDGTQIVSSSCDSTVRIWNTQTGQCLHTLEDHTKLVKSVCYSPDGTQLASASYDQTICIWNAKTYEYLNTLKDHKDSVTSVCYSPDGTFLTSASWDKTILIGDTKTGKSLKTLEGHNKWVKSVCYSPDGTCIASFAYEDKAVHIWDIAKPVRDLKQQNYSQILFHALCKKTIENNKIFNATKNVHLLDVFNSLPKEQQEFLKKITSLPLTQKILRQLYNYKNPIAVATVVGLSGLALHTTN